MTVTLANNQQLCCSFPALHVITLKALAIFFLTFLDMCNIIKLCIIVPEWVLLDLSVGIILHYYIVKLSPLLVPVLQYLEMLRSVQNRPVKCLTIMWALGQAGFYDLSQGLRGNKHFYTEARNNLNILHYCISIKPKTALNK